MTIFVCIKRLLFVFLLVNFYGLADAKNYYDLLQNSKKKKDVKVKPAKPGCEYKEINIEKYGLDPFVNPKTIYSKNGELSTTLSVEYSDPNIAGCETHLRTYNGELLGPTFRLKPGDTLRVKLQNKMPACDARFPERCSHGEGEMNNPGMFNVTNLHTHGFHVSPAGNSDNVLLQIRPGVEFDYEINIPGDHPSGTFWYHAHVHGSTALQVSSGMAGSLIIEGGLDDAPGIKDLEEKTFVFQQVAYDCHGVIESYTSQCPDNIGGFGPNKWKDMKRHILINGSVVPSITMRPGEIQRWRFIHAGIRETIMVRVEDQRGYVQEKLHEIAVDGLATGRLDAWSKLELQPGYRSDVLYRAPKKTGEYWLMDVETSSELSLHGVTEPAKKLARIVVEGKAKAMNFPKPETLVKLKAMKDFTKQEIAKLSQTKEPMMFYLGDVKDIPSEPCGKFDNKNSGELIFSVNGIPFSKDHVRELTLNTAEKWTLCTRGLAPAHPFHIHVNPFQLERIGPDGRPQNVWRDTVLVRSRRDVEIYTRYEDYVGEFVLHCHILDHEDQGMMELVKINLEGSDGHH